MLNVSGFRDGRGHVSHDPEVLCQVPYSNVAKLPENVPVSTSILPNCRNVSAGKLCLLLFLFNCVLCRKEKKNNVVKIFRVRPSLLIAGLQLSSEKIMFLFVW